MANTTWSVTPSDGVINIGNGVFSFPENTTSEDIEYTVSFYSEACGCNCSKTVVIEAAPCKCTVTSNYGDEEHAIGPEAGTDVVVGTIDNCADEVTWEKIDGGEFVGNISVNENNEIVVASISENGGGARYAEYSASCDSILTIWQKKHTGCPSESTIIQTIGRLPDTGGTGITIFKILKNDAYTGYNFSGDTNNIITNFDVSDDDVDNWYNVTANVAANDGGERPIYIKVRLNGGTSVPDEGCLYDSVKLTQKGKCVIEWLGDEECVMCDCNQDDFQLVSSTIDNIPIEGYDNIIGTVGDCIDKTTMELVNNTWGENTVKLQYLDENNNIYLVVTGNDGAAREETVKIAYSATCGEDGVIWEKSLTLRQDGDGCGCDSITIEGDEEPDPEPEPAIGKLYIKLGTAPSWATSGNYDIFLVKDDFTDSQVNTMKGMDPTVIGTTDSEGRTYLCNYEVENNGGTCTYVEDSIASGGLWMFYNDGGTVETTDFIEDTLCWVYIREKTGQKRIERLDNRVEFKPSSVNCNDYVMMT